MAKLTENANKMADELEDNPRWPKVPELLRKLAKELEEALVQKDFLKDELENLKEDKNRLVEVRDKKDDKIAELQTELNEIRAKNWYKVASEQSERAVTAQSRLAAIVEETAKEIETENTLVAERDAAVDRANELQVQHDIQLELKEAADEEVNRLYRERVLPAEALLLRCLDVINADAETVLVADLRAALEGK